MVNAREITRTALVASTLVGVIRAQTEARARAIATGMRRGGLRALEVTVTTPGCHSVLRELKESAPELTLGVGTVTAPGQLHEAARAGLAFAVSPHTDPALIETGAAAGLVVIPGAFTATEILAAHRAGADFVKLFPVTAGGGPQFVRTLRGPLPRVPLWVSGDVQAADIGDYLRAGATLIGLTSALSGGLEDLAEDDIRDRVEERARHCLAVWAAARDEAEILTLTAPGQRWSLSLASLRALEGSEHVDLEDVGVGRRGRGVRVKAVLAPASIPASALLRVRSSDGFYRDVQAETLLDSGILQYALDGRPLEAKEGGPLRLFIVDGSDRCANVKAISSIELLGSESPSQ